MVTLSTESGVPSGDIEVDSFSFILDRLGWQPTASQAPILSCNAQNIAVSGGDRSGKSEVSAKFLIKRDLEWDGPPDEARLYWLVAADYSRTRKEFDILIDNYTRLGLGTSDYTKRVDPGHFVLQGGTKIQTKSAKDPRTLAMDSPHGIVVCEASQIDIETFHRLLGRLLDKNGWLLLSGSLEMGSPWYSALITNWLTGIDGNQSFLLPTPSNTYLFPGGIQDEKIQRLRRTTSDRFFTERIMGKPVPPLGLVHPGFRSDLHVKSVKYRPGEDVYLAVDPGTAGAYAVEACHVVMGEDGQTEQVQVFDEIYEQGLITAQIVQIVNQKKWAKDIKKIVIDVYARQRQSMPPVAEVWLKETGHYTESNKVFVRDQIEIMDRFLTPHPITGQPMIVFAPHCRGVLSEFGAGPNPFDGLVKPYTWRLDSNNGVVGKEPDDRYRHAIQATCYFLVSQYGYAFRKRRATIRVKHW